MKPELEMTERQLLESFHSSIKDAQMEKTGDIKAFLEDGFVQWGSQGKGTMLTSLGSLVLLFGCPIWTTSNWIVLEHFNGSLTSMLNDFTTKGPVNFMQLYRPRGTAEGGAGFLAWILFQAALYVLLPGPICSGQLTPAGNILKYTTNGLSAWLVTCLLALAAWSVGLIELAMVANNFESLVVAANMYGILLSVLCIVKAYLKPSYPNDRKFSGSLIYDLFVGIELNPRLGDTFDLKFFHIGRPSMISWTVIDLSYAARQYQVFGKLTASMVHVNLFSLIYCVDFFINEDWYLRTIDINHDHFGFYLAWGSTVLLPNIYTLQAQYLARYPIELPRLATMAILLAGLGGYAMFRSANYQKDLVRQTDGNCSIFGRKADYIRCKYRTSDGKEHESLLLVSGWWGFSKHANYVGDLILSYSMCAPCGLANITPWFYAFFITAILLHRSQRDEQRCARKYGKYWQQYTAQVKWRLIPGLW